MTTKLKIKRANTHKATAIAPSHYTSHLPWSEYMHAALSYQARLRATAMRYIYDIGA